MAEILPEIETFARIRVVGIGGGGGNALNGMVQSKLRGIDFIAVNTDAQALHHSQASIKVHIGKEATRGLGAGSSPEIGRQAAEESEEAIFNALKHSEMVFITAGYGGGTGTGAAPVVARIAKEIGALTVAIVTKPFSFEGTRRRKIAEAGIDELRDKVDTLIVIPNDHLLQLVDRKTTLLDAFSTVDDVLKKGVQGIADLITVNGLVNLDFADVKSIMSNAGSALMGIGQGSGETRAIDAVKIAMDSPLLDISIQGAKGVLINFTGGRDMGMHEIEEAAKLIHDSVDPEANIIWGTVLDEDMVGEIRVTLVATGFDTDHNSHSIPAQPSEPTDEQDDDLPTSNDDLLVNDPFGSTASPRDEDDPFIKESIVDNHELDFDADIFKDESETSGISDKPIISILEKSPDDDSKYERPTYDRTGVKIGEPKNDDNDNDRIPNIVKKKL